MGQGRISFSRGSHRDHSFRPGQDGAFDTGADIPLLLTRLRSAEVALPQPMAEVADEWILESIERKRARLLQVSMLQRHRIEEFVDLLFDEQSDRCQEMMDVSLAENGDPQKVVELLLEPAARVIGENWCTDDCDFLKVTIAVSRMQRLFRRMSSEHPPTNLPDLSRCALLTPAPGEQHTFGLSIVDDAFRRAGWEVDCCGVDEEAETLRLVAANHYQVIGISVSVERRLPDLAAMGRRLRSRSRNRSIVLIAGGSMVMQNPQGAIDAGFDLLAVDAVSAVILADTVVASVAPDVDPRVAAE
jgi:methanogenic corrinoid protein MtbC1